MAGFLFITASLWSGIIANAWDTVAGMFSDNVEIIGLGLGVTLFITLFVVATGRKG